MSVDNILLSPSSQGPQSGPSASLLDRLALYSSLLVDAECSLSQGPLGPLWLSEGTWEWHYSLPGRKKIWESEAVCHMTFSITSVTRGLLSTGSFTGAPRGVGIVVSVPLAGIADLLSFMSAASTVASKEKDENRLSPLGEASFNQQTRHKGFTRRFDITYWIRFNIEWSWAVLFIERRTQK